MDNLLGIVLLMLYVLGVAFHMLIARQSTDRWTKPWSIFGFPPLLVGWLIIALWWDTFWYAETVASAAGFVISTYLVSLIFGWAVYWLLRKKFGLFRESSKTGKIIRGAHLLSEKKLVSLMVNELAKAKIGNIPVPVRVENRNFMIAGSVGSGKSQTFYQLLDSVRVRGQAALVADMSGDFVSRYYRPGKDVILNPLEARGVAWSPFAEMEQPYDAVNLARSFIPQGKSADEEQWNGYAREVFEAVFQRLFQLGLPTNQLLVDGLNALGITDLKALTAGTMISAQFDAEKMWLSIKPIINKYIKILGFMEPQAGVEAFSVKRFVRDAVAKKQDAPWIFLLTNENNHKLLQPLVAAQIDIASRTLMSLQPDESRRFWFSLDEFASLGYVDSVEDLYTKGRKYGAAAIMGIQAVSQIRGTYGYERAQTIMATADTWLLLRNKDADSAEFMARQIGTNELRRTVYNSSANESLKTTQGQSEQYNDKNQLVLPSEIQMLPDRKGYINIGGMWGTTTIPINMRQATQPHYEPKSIIKQIEVGKEAERIRAAVAGGPEQEFDVSRF